MALLRLFFYTAVLLQCRVLETGGECTEMAVRSDFMAVHAAVCLADMLSWVMVETCVFAFDRCSGKKGAQSKACRVSLEL